MASFNIELRNADRVIESIAVEREDIPALRIEVAQFIGEYLRDHAERLWLDEAWRLDATNEDGLILFILNLVATDSAALLPAEALRAAAPGEAT